MGARIHISKKEAHTISGFWICNEAGMEATISATQRANELIAGLKAKHGRLSFHLSGRFGQTLSCLPEGELRIGCRDVLMGHFSGIPLYMMTDEADAWKDRDMVISLVRGPTRGFSLEEGSGYHFVLYRPRWANSPSFHFLPERLCIAIAAANG